ncbi:hypothetical protein AAZX31_03G120900 [Glycine max]
MALLKHLISFTIIIISFVACYSTLQENPPSSIYNMIKQSANVLSLNKFDYKLGNTPFLEKVNVNDYGAKGNGSTDDTEIHIYSLIDTKIGILKHSFVCDPFNTKLVAFNKAWQVVCSTGEAILVVPQGNYLLKPIRFSGPCKPNFAVQISGTLEASDDPSDYSGDNRHWLVFDNIQKLFVYGGGTINGNGNISNVEATDNTCGPGHGIRFLEGVIRIKTWQGGSGSASNIQFQNIEMDNVTNPIIINQNYCDHKKRPCKTQHLEKSAIQINVLYQNITGTSTSDVAVKLACSENFPCQEIVLQNINLECEGDAAYAICNNVELSYLGHVNPRCKSQREIKQKHLLLPPYMERLLIQGHMHVY